MNERAVELPLAFGILDRLDSSRVLEVGNVISHYRDSVRHDVVDRYETGDPRVLNSDARCFNPSSQYDVIISLSTLEHVGWDESPRNPEKAWETILHLTSLLAPGGTFLFTVPTGYHPRLCRSILESRELRKSLRALKRVSIWNEWEECSPEEAGRCEFGKPYPFANAIFVGCAGSRATAHARSAVDTG